MPAAEPFVSVVTPFYNTDPYLAECVESVLRQQHQNLEYVLVNNQSTDQSAAIAARYAEKDPRIRVVTTPKFFTQVQNYNFALGQVSPEARYVKIVQADDWIYPSCLTEMVALAEAHPAVDVVSSYELRESDVHGAGLHASQKTLSGRDAVRLFLLEGLYFFGSPTSVLFRATAVRARVPFYEEGRLQEDTEAVIELLRHAEFGFVHQVLSFIRQQQQSITGAAHDLLPHQLDRLVTVKRYGREFLDDREYEACLEDARRWYYRSLAGRLLLSLATPPSDAFWAYQKKAFAVLGERLDRVLLAKYMADVVLENVANPGTMLRNLMRSRKRVASKPRVADTAARAKR